MEGKIIWICVYVLMLCSGLNCYPVGAPDQVTACENMLPLHSAAPPENVPTDPAPFAFAVSQTSYDPGVNITGL